MRKKSIYFLVFAIICLFLNTVSVISISSVYVNNYDESASSANSLQILESSNTVEFQLPSHKLITGSRLLLSNPNILPEEINLEYGEKDYISIVESKIEIPEGITETWYEDNLLGKYVLTDLPSINFYVEQTIAPRIHVDTSSSGNSYQDGSALSVEYMIDLKYEDIVSIQVGKSDTGDINTDDYCDAYQVSLISDHKYKFTLEITGGSADLRYNLLGDLSDVIVDDNDMLSNGLTSQSSNTLNVYSEFTATSSTIHLLIVEYVGWQDIADEKNADYTISFADVTPDDDDDDVVVEDPVPGFPAITIIIGTIASIYYKGKRKLS